MRAYEMHASEVYPHEMSSAVVTDRPDPKFGLGSVWSIDLDPVYRPALTRLGLLSLWGGVDELYDITVNIAVTAIRTV
jgi:hypothetical protein